MYIAFAQKARRGLLAAEPGSAAAGLANEGAQLAMPEAAQAFVVVDLANDSQRTTMLRPAGHGSIAAHGGGCGYLDLALDQLDGCEDEGGEGAGKGARSKEGRERQRLVAGEPATPVDGLAADALKGKQAAVLEGGANERRTDAAVQADQAVGADGLAEAVDGALVEQRQVVGLRLETNLDGVKGILDVLANDAGNLKVRKEDGGKGPGESARTDP